jgi:hypothetical protein
LARSENRLLLRQLKVIFMRKTLYAIFVLLFVNQVFAQVCTPDSQYTEVGIYPEQMPDGRVGQSYSQVLQFVLPKDTMGYEFTNFKILSVSLPVGLQWECSNASNGCNYDPRVSVNGCGLVFGTPLLAGSYLVDVNVIADLTVAQGIPFSFQLPLTILPFAPNDSNDGFTMFGAFACTPAAVSFQNNNPGMLAYSWSFGNGNTSTLENPAPQLYMQPGEYIVNYEAFSSLDTIEVFTLTSLTINSMSGYGEGFPSYETADPYFILLENNVPVYQSPIIMDTNPPVSWSLNIVLNRSSTYRIEVWEADETAGEWFFFGDDFIGRHTLNFNGCGGCALSGGGGNGNISYVVSYQQIFPFPAVTSQDTVRVFPYPDQPVINYDMDQNIMSVEDEGLVYQWYFNGMAIPGASETSFSPWVSGTYTVAAFNLGGCSTMSQPVTGVVCTFYIPGIFTTSSEVVLSNPLSGASYQWFFNGDTIQGATGLSVSIDGVGSYSIVVTDAFGCIYPSSAISFAVGLESQYLPVWSIYPNPSDENIFVQLESVFEVRKLTITDVSGRVMEVFHEHRDLYSVQVRDWPAGVYFVLIENEFVTHTKRFIKN